MRLLLALLLLVSAVRCNLVDCPDPCGGTAGGAVAGGSGGSAGGVAGGSAGGATAGGSAGGDAGGSAGGAAGGSAGGAAGGTAGGATAGGAGHLSRVFVTDSTFHGNFGAQAGGFLGAAAADKLCANAASFAGVQGAFKAWASGASESPGNRLNDSSPWVLMGTSQVLFATKSSLTLGPTVAINRNERGFVVSGSTAVWTGATGAFVAPAANCTGWTTNQSGTSAVVGTVSNGTMWTSTGTPQVCNLTARLYCFEQQ
ncbi:MAG: hypothetical protein IPJ65_12280 [Archangiaceae bacterium]|nr:hypothetical protein [Archangiaceae bacterium]